MKVQVQTKTKNSTIGLSMMSYDSVKIFRSLVVKFQQIET